MGIQKGAATAISVVSTAALKHVFHRPAANFPGKVALYVDPRIIADMAPKLREGSICVVGTNGKTTITNMIADALEADGKTVVCNRTGANLDSGVATSLLHAQPSDWGVFECDELWLAKILPFTQSKYVLLLNLFRDQLDRCGEIDRIQDSIVNALATSPDTVLVYNGDDPLCEAIARKAANRHIAFGIGEDLHLPQNTVSDARMCQRCESMLDYTYRQYGQLGAFFCPNCDFKRAPLRFAARNCVVADEGMAFDVLDAGDGEDAASSVAVEARTDVDKPTCLSRITADYTGVYMIYNLLAVFTAAHLMGATAKAVQTAVDAFNPQNGRLQYLQVKNRRVLLNLAKNPTGFNQNLKLVTQAPGRKAAAFFINDKEADGHDISWIWDVDFEELAAQPDVVVYAGGIRKNDLQMRLKYAGVQAQLVDGAADAMALAEQLPADYQVYMIANYTSLPGVRADLMRLAKESDGQVRAANPNADGVNQDAGAQAASAAREASPSTLIPQDKPLRIIHMLPDLLNLYGDGGNLKVLKQRCAWRGIPAEVVAIEYGQDIDLSTADIVFLGGGPDREQKLASEQLLRVKDDLRAYVESDGVLLAICGGYQILGPTWLMGEESVEGLDLAGIETRRAHAGFDRLIDNIVLKSSLAKHYVVGYENHAGRTYLDEGLHPFGRVVNHVGYGNNDDDAADGVLYKNVIGTYLHGPLLGKNPEIADWLLQKAIERRTGAPCQLPALDDTVELEANSYMCNRLGAHE